MFKLVSICKGIDVVQGHSWDRAEALMHATLSNNCSWAPTFLEPTCFILYKKGSGSNLNFPQPYVLSNVLARSALVFSYFLLAECYLVSLFTQALEIHNNSYEVVLYNQNLKATFSYLEVGQCYYYSHGKKDTPAYNIRPM